MQTIAQLNTTVDIQLEVLSPLHIGTAGEKLWKQNIDYFYTGDEVVIVDQTKLIRALIEATTDDGTSALQAFQSRLASGRNWDLEGFLEECDIDPVEVQVASYPVEIEPAAEIRPLIRTGYGQTIIPGSSIKGAMRSVLFHYLYQQDLARGDAPEKELFGNISNNLLKYIRPGDAVCHETTITNSELFNLYQEYGNWESDYKPGFIVSTESFVRGATAKFRLAIADGLHRRLKEINSRSREDLIPRHAGKIVDVTDPISHLFTIINDYTRTHLERELAF
ncbi:MAG: type III-A CRISPR-associated RAMP protein Csm5, partial [Saprospiraceae bacterium]|nr:type III-A CRISPR-associated RAMP protein Csm5 [Saprospiraceae bacterium]